MPNVTVILPVFNACRYVRSAVESILRQTYTDFEVVMIDDGSTDGTGEILDRLARADRRIRLLHRENRGYTRTLNEAIDLATGRYLARMDADDVSLPQRLELQVAYLDSHPRCAAVGTWIELVDPEGDPICCWRYPRDHREIDAQHMQGLTSCIAHPAVMMRKDLVQLAGTYRPALEPAEDFDLWLRLSDQHELGNVPEVLLLYRLHEASQSHLRRQQQLDRTRQALSEARARRGTPELAWPADKTARAENTRRYWVKLAHDAGEFSNARRLALKALRHAPLSSSSWRAVVVAILGPWARHLVEYIRNPGVRHRRTDPSPPLN